MAESLLDVLVKDLRAKRDAAMDAYHRHGGDTARGIDAYADAVDALSELFDLGAACPMCEGDVDNGTCQSCGHRALPLCPERA
jgi:hypothetical protein